MIHPSRVGGLPRTLPDPCLVLCAALAVLVLCAVAGPAAWGRVGTTSHDRATTRTARCPAAAVFRAKTYRYIASDIKRSSKVPCRFAVRLLKGAYHQGPLKPTRVVYPHTADGQIYGRPTYHFRHGWRCSNGAGGAECWNISRRSLNPIHNPDVSHGFAVTATVDYAEGAASRASRVRHCRDAEFASGELDVLHTTCRTGKRVINRALGDAPCEPSPAQRRSYQGCIGTKRVGRWRCHGLFPGEGFDLRCRFGRRRIHGGAGG